MLLTDQDRKIISAALGWGAMEYARLAKVADEKTDADAAKKWLAMASECARQADAFHRGARMMMTSGDQTVMGAALRAAAAEWNARGIEAGLKGEKGRAGECSGFASECGRLAALFPKPH